MEGLSQLKFNLSHIIVLNYIVIACLAFFLFFTIQDPVLTSFLSSQEEQDHFIKQVTERKTVELIAFDDVAGDVAKNNLFELQKPPEILLEEVAAEPVKAEPIKVDFQLVGLIEDLKGVEAVFENKETRQTFFLKKGQEFDGFKLVDVQEEKVILEKGEERIELHKNEK